MESFRISVCALPAGRPSPLEAELQLLKIALLYGDSVVFLGAASGPRSLFLGLDNLPVEDQIRRFVDVGMAHPEHIVSLSPDSREKFLLLVTYIDKMEHAERTRQWTARHAGVRRKIHAIWREMQAGSLRDPLLRQYQSAKGSGMAEFRLLDYRASFQAQSRAYVDYAAQQIQQAGSYPLMDALTGFLADGTSKRQPGGVLRVTTRDALTHMGFVAYALGELPAFEGASVEEVLAVREELSKHLTRFRAGMLEFSHDVQSLPWEPSFEREADLLFREKVLPAVEDISTAARENSIVDAIVRRIHEKPGATMSGLGSIAGGITLALSPGHLLGEVLANSLGLGLGAAATAASVLALGALHEQKKQQAGLEKKQMYFYYRAGERLSSRSR